MDLSGFWGASAVIGIVALAGCDLQPDRGRAVYDAKCTGCHGVSGTGDGPFAAQLLRPPADLSRLALDNGGDFPRARVLAVVDGYGRAEHFNNAMPRFGEDLTAEGILLESNPGRVTPPPPDLLAVVGYLETLQVTE